MGDLGGTEFPAKRAIDIFGRGTIPFGTIIDFVASCAVFAEEIEKERPDILFVPLRGASPMAGMAANFLEGTGLMPKVVPLPVGSHTYFTERRGRQVASLRGITRSDKARIVDETFAKLLADGVYSPTGSTLMVVDEVQRGSTLTVITRSIGAAMCRVGDTSQLRVFAFRDNRTRAGWMDSYLRIGRDLAVKDLGTTTKSLFTVDSAPLLDRINNVDPHAQHSTTTLLATENTEARTVFRAIYDTYVQPQTALDEIRAIRHGDVGGDDGVAGTALARVLGSVEGVPDATEPRRRATRGELLAWWEELGRQVIKHRRL